ncbi:2-hydroxyacid dehydrogenase [Caballeronia insecticola]|uniref:D-isomer specific 2-hydroxyacid dehydrogenase NAD binding domain protein 4 n=1 Tax=Caballeronia insecticola TaxID=758793 RepID=R4WPG0_9BURK|nr:2-hydroxyacid dehydrogenase [Caballeronia insecticola]BAN26474.1 D-isomer specific 2-hydroxyacid dehydrogenase NAD binding domain protein 4 [Caballeronia insecticola]
MQTDQTIPPVLQIGAFPAGAQALLDARLDLHALAAIDADDALRQRIGAIVTRSNYDIDAALIERLPSLRIIATSGVGFDRIPVEFARARGVVVTNTPDLLNAAVAELTIGLVLALLRQLPQANRFVREGAWSSGAFALGTSLAGKRVGIVGMGRIGREIARRLAPFDVDIAYFGRTRQPLTFEWFDEPAKLARWSDILIASCPGGQATHHLIDAAVLDALGSSGMLVNIARGSVVDEKALALALERRTIAGAALDVFECEPLGESPLRALDNVVLSPHIGSATHETRLAMARLTIDNVVSFFTTGQALTPVV